jgi:tryptophan synthase alpha chain
MTRIDQRFVELKKEQRKGFIAYITAGDPSLKDTEDIVLCFEQAGVDVVELGIPFSDPLADGRVNQQSAMRALESGTTLRGVLNMVERLRRKTQLPLMCYTYMNPIHAAGAEAVAKRAGEAGLDGLLFLDLPVEESAPYVKLLRRHHLNNICLVTPTSPEERIRRIVRHATGFVYCVSREGVTGMQKRLNEGAVQLVQRTKRLSGLPVALGFGIGSPEQAAAARAADAVVVGSAIVDRLDSAPHNHRGHERVARWVGRMVKAVKEA